MNIYKFENHDLLYDAVFKQVIEVVKNKKSPVLGLATGSTPVPLYQRLIQDHKNNQTSFQHVSTFNLDEYVGLNVDHPQSYRFFMNQNLFNHIDISIENTEVPNGLADDLEIECARYNKKLKAHKIDIQILGIGSNGHIAFNEPGTTMNSVTRVVHLDEQTRKDNARFFNSLDEVPFKAITMGIDNILYASQIILIAVGKQKAQAVYQMVNKPMDSSCPASYLQKHKNVHLFLDLDSASLL
jgi:glucosamine-6-phosphate deaminase